MMKRLLAFLLICGVLLGSAGCGKPDDQPQSSDLLQQEPTQDFPLPAVIPGESHSDFPGIEIRIDSLQGADSEGNVSLVVTWKNQTDFNVTYGAAYTVERLELEGWGSCAIQDELAFDAIGYELKSGTTTNNTYNLTNAYDVSTAGIYRFKTTCYVYERPDRSTQCELVAEFAVGNAERPDAIWREGSDVEWSARFIRTYGYCNDENYPSAVVIKSQNELNDYCKNNTDVLCIENKGYASDDLGVSLSDAFAQYDAAFFEENYLIFILLEEGSGSVTHEIRSVTRTQDQKICVSVDSILPDGAGTSDMAQWHIVLELSRDVLMESAKDVIVYWNDVLRWDGSPLALPKPGARFKKPPEGYIRTPMGNIPLVLGGYNWYVENPDGTTTMTVADATSRPLPKESLTPVRIPGELAQTVYVPVPDPANKVIYKPTDEIGYEVMPNWAEWPTHVTCTRWPEAVWQDSSTQGETTEFGMEGAFLYALDGGYIFEFSATWPQGDEGYYGTANYYAYVIGGADCDDKPMTGE